MCMAVCKEALVPCLPLPKPFPRARKKHSHKSAKPKSTTEPQRHREIVFLCVSVPLWFKQRSHHHPTVMPDSDSSATVFKSRAKELAALLATSEERARLWRPDELAAIFRHQISAPMLIDLGSFDPRTAAQLKIVSEAQGLLLKSFSDLFHHPAPPVELLELVKDFAKANLDHPESGLPSEISAALYYTSIAAALVHLDKRISKLPDTDLRRGLNWTREQGWLDDYTKELLGVALAKISGDQKGGKS